MKNYTIYKIIFYVLLISIFLSCKCETYFSNNDKSRIKSTYFDLEIMIDENEVRGNPDFIIVSLYFKDKDSLHVSRNEIIISPKFDGKGELPLKLIQTYSSQYIFEYSEKSKSKLNVMVNFELDSFGIKRKKVSVFDNLKNLNKCRYRPVLH